MAASRFAADAVRTYGVKLDSIERRQEVDRD